MGFDLGISRSQCGGGGKSVSASGDCQRVSQSASAGLMSPGLAAMFYSNQTLPFGRLVGQANASQRAGMLNRWLSAMSPSRGGAALTIALAKMAESHNN